MTKTYEAMFIVEPSKGTKDNNILPEVVQNILNRYNVKVLKQIKWAERKLSYPIKGNRRATYYLAYFDSNPESIAKISQECKLTAGVLRTLVLLSSLNLKEMDKILSAVQPESQENTAPRPVSVAPQA